MSSLEARVERAEARSRDAARLAQIVSGPPGPRHAKPKRDRHGLHVIPGGLAALAPAALVFHDGLPAALVAGFRWLWRADRSKSRLAASALLLGLAGAYAVPASVVADYDGPRHSLSRADFDPPRHLHRWDMTALTTRRRRFPP